MGGVVDSVFGGGGGDSSSSSNATTNNTSNVTVNPTTTVTTNIDLAPIQRLAEALSGVSTEIVEKNAEAQNKTQESNKEVVTAFTDFLKDSNKQQFIIALATIGAGLWIKGKIKL